MNGKLRGDPAAATVRNSYLYFSKGAACQLAMGVSAMEPNNVWVGMPPHLHNHRTEVYLYTGFPEENRVYHFMGKPGATRTLAVKNEQAVISPSWSVHSAVGHHSFSIIWGTCGEVSESGVSQPLLPETLGG